MSLKYSQGIYEVQNRDKYVGIGNPKYRSSWELSVMTMCDNNPAISQWASESIKIPYKDPLTGKQTVYVPDFLVVFIDNNKRKRAELWEVKPAKQAFKESVGKNKYDQAQYVRNMVKWAAARAFCDQNNLYFRIITEKELYFNGKKK